MVAAGGRAAAPSGLHLLSDSRPARAGIVRPEEAAFAFLRGDQRVDDSGSRQLMPRPMRPISTVGSPLLSFVHVRATVR